MRGKGEGAVYRVPADTSKPLQFWTAAVELPPQAGVRRRKVIRSKNKRTVITKLAALQEELRQHGDLYTDGQTVEQWFTYWLESLAPKHVRPNTLAGYRPSVRKYIIPTIGKVRLDRLTPAHIRRVHDAVVNTPKDPKDPSKGMLSSSHALSVHRVLSASLAVAEREGRINRNPAKLTPAPKRSTNDLDVLDLDEAIRILEIAATPEHAELGSRWATALLTGARRGEVIGLERDRVGDTLDLSWQLQRLKVTDTPGVPDVPADFEYRHLAGGLYLTPPKSAAGVRIIPLVDPLKSILEKYMASTPPNRFGLVWAPGDWPLDPSQDSMNWREMLKAAGVDKNVRLHDVRHTTVDLLYLAGVPEDLIQLIVGHSTIAMTRKYKSRGKVNTVRLTAAMEQFSSLFTTLDRGRSGTPSAIAS